MEWPTVSDMAKSCGDVAIYSFKKVFFHSFVEWSQSGSQWQYCYKQRKYPQKKKIDSIFRSEMMLTYKSSIYVSSLNNFTLLPQSTWPLMHQLQQQRPQSGHRLLKHSGSPALLLFPCTLSTLLHFLTSYTSCFLFFFGTFAPRVQFSESSTSGLLKLSTLSLPLVPPLSPFVFYSVQVFCFPCAATLLFSHPVVFNKQQ